MLNTSVFFLIARNYFSSIPRLVFAILRHAQRALITKTADAAAAVSCLCYVFHICETQHRAMRVYLLLGPPRFDVCHLLFCVRFISHSLGVFGLVSIYIDIIIICYHYTISTVLETSKK